MRSSSLPSLPDWIVSHRLFAKGGLVLGFLLLADLPVPCFSDAITCSPCSAFPCKSLVQKSQGEGQGGREWLLGRALD